MSRSSATRATRRSVWAAFRYYCDALSPALMVSNDRIAAQGANLLPVFKDDQE